MGKRPAPRMLQSEILGAEQRRIPRNMVVLGSTLVVVCVTCFVLAVAHEANGGSFESLNENPRLEDLYHAFVYNKHPPTVSPTPVPSINLGGEPVVAPGSYVTESSNKTLSDLQLKTRKDMEMVNLITRDIYRAKHHVDDRQAGAGAKHAGYDQCGIFFIPTKFDGVQHDLSAYSRLAGGGTHGSPIEFKQTVAKYGK